MRNCINYCIGSYYFGLLVYAQAFDYSLQYCLFFREYQGAAELKGNESITDQNGQPISVEIENLLNTEEVDAHKVLVLVEA